MLFQPSNITPDEINGTGTVDVTEDVAVTWQVSGDSAMTAYQIDIYQNDAASTSVYSTGKVSLSTPFWGVDYAGNTQYFSMTLGSSALTGAGMSNGNEYKMLITQWWSADDSVTQMTASMFLTRANPTITIDAIDDPVDSTSYTFTATYAQAQGDALKWVRWQIAYSDDTSSPFVDTGNIYGTGELKVEYDGFLTGTTYSINCTVETANGVQATTGWQDFNVEYELTTTTGTADACQLKNECCVWVSWDRVESADGYTIFRQKAGENRLFKIADVESTAGQIRDYSAQSGQTYTYYVFPVGPLAYLTEPMVSAPVKVQYWFWAIVEATELTPNSYAVSGTYYFKYGAGGVSEGQISNNNAPQLEMNFTRYPTRQGSTSNYLTGTVAGYIGSISKPSIQYSDTIAQSDALFQLSNSENALFLIDPKGHFLRIHTSAAVTLQIDHKSREMPQTVTLSWAEIGSTDNVHLIMYQGGDFYPVDRIILTTVSVDISNGVLYWETPDDYSGTGSVLSMSDGALIQDDTGSFVSAVMAIEPDTAELTATLPDS